MSSVDDLPPPMSGIDDLPAPPSPGFVDGAIKSTINSLPMIGGVIGGAIGTPADLVSGPMGTVVGAGIGGSLGAATKNLINRYYDPDAAPKTNTQALVDPMIAGANQASMQGVSQFAAPYIAKGIDAAGNAVSSAAKWAGTKALSNLGGVAPNTIKEYAQFSDRINASQSLDKLKDISDEFVGKLASDVDAGKVSADQAKEAYKSFHSDLKDAYKTAGYDARDAVTSAQQSLKDAHNSRIQQLSGDIYDSVNRLKSDVQSGSTKALGVLNKSSAVIDTTPVVSHIDDTIANLQKAGTDESLAVADRLGAYKQRLVDANGSGLIPAADAKKLIQGIDQTTTYSPMAGAFDKAKNSAFKGVRSALDQSVKTAVPEYAQAMEPVAANADLLSRVQDFGDKQSAAGILQRINAPNQLERKAALTELGQKYDADFVGASNPSSLPEAEQLQKAQGIQDSLRPDLVAQKIDQRLATSPQKATLDTAQSSLSQAQQRLTPFKSLAPNAAGQTQSQQKLTSLGKGGNIELTDMFQKLGSMTNTDFVQAMKDQNTLAAFQKGATNGSRNTLMGAVSGWLFGGPTGGAIGAGAGRMVDQWGPAVTKKVLDGAIAVSKSPTVSTIANLEVPEAAKRSMIVGLENYMSKGGASAPASLVAQNSEPANRSPARGQDAWAGQGLRSLGIQDPALSKTLLADPKAKQLLIEASNYPAGSKQAKRIMSQIQKGWGQ